MKKLILLMVAFVFVTGNTIAEVTTCVTATTAPLPLHNSTTSQSITGSQGWFSFVADSNTVSVGIQNSGSPSWYVLAAGVYKGTCSGLELINSDVVNPNSPILLFTAKGLVAGTTYYLQLKRPLPTGQTTFSSSTFTLSIGHLQTYSEVCEYLKSDNANFNNNIFMSGDAQIEAAIRDYIYTTNHKTLTSGIYQIPVVVHVIYNSSTHRSNISYAQIQWQIAALNAALSNNYGAYDVQKVRGTNAVDTRIRMCLAQTPIGPASWTNYQEPGVMRYPTTNAAVLYPKVINNSPDYTALVNLTRNNNNPAYFPYNKVLNIWVVEGFTSSTGVVENNPGTVGLFADQFISTQANTPANISAINIDGIICRSDCFGDITYAAGCTTNFKMNDILNHGTVMAHELGHYFCLDHTFKGNCSGKGVYNAATDDCSLFGDKVCDTPPCIVNNYNGGAAPSVCGGAPRGVQSKIAL